MTAVGVGKNKKAPTKKLVSVTHGFGFVGKTTTVQNLWENSEKPKDPNNNVSSATILNYFQEEATLKLNNGHEETMPIEIRDTAGEEMFKNLRSKNFK